MWRGPGQEPGGPGPPQSPSTSQELNDLKDQYEQQQLLIAQLKEMLRKTEQTSATQEKVEEYANTLTKMNERVKRSIVMKEGSTEVVDTLGSKKIETPASEKINMLRQQLEQNKVKLAERGKSQKGIEEIVTQIKAQLDDSQNLMNQTPLNLSLVDTRTESYSPSSNSQELYNILLGKDKRISDMAAKIQKLEANVLDLQENVKEKDSVIDARTKAITLMSENLSKKGKSTLDALDETKLQMRTMQENFIELESKMKEEKQKLIDELELKNSQINSLQQANDFLHKTRQELLETNSELHEKLDNPDELRSHAESLEILKLNQRIKELEELHSNLQKTTSIDEADFRNDLETINAELKVRIDDLEKVVTEKDVQIRDFTTKDSPKHLNLDIKLENEEVVKLKKQLDESNKNMIKVKAQNKSKIKDLNKKIDAFKKMGDANAAVLRLQDENSKLNNKIVELEEEKGALQLKIMESDSAKESINVEHINELEKKMSEQTEQLSAKEDTINSLEKQIEDYVLRIDVLSEKLDSMSHLQNAQVKSEITSIHFEEQLDKIELEKQVLLKEKEETIKENEALLEKVEALSKEKQELVVKLDSYIQENIDLMDKLEKLSAEKVSSAESIEMVEGLTQQETLELEAYQKSLNTSSDHKTSTEHLEENPELSESVHQLTEETTELLQRIELFTVERREVMEKMENLNHENNQLNLRIKEIENNRDVLAETYEQLQNEKEHLDSNLNSLLKEKFNLEEKLKVLETENEKLKQEIINIREEKTFKSEIISDLHSSTQIVNENLVKEIDEYKALIEIQKQEISDLRLQLMQVDKIRNEKFTLEEKLGMLQSEYETLLSENENMKRDIKRDAENVHEKDAMEKELTIANKRIIELDKKITNNLNEIENYKLILEENKTELTLSTKLIFDLQNNIQQKETELSDYKNEVTQLNSNLSELNTALTQLEHENNAKAQNTESIDIMSTQLQELKSMLNDNIQQIKEYEAELETNSEIINQLQKEIKTLNNKMVETEHLVEYKDDEIKVLQKEKDAKEVIIANLQDHIVHLKEDFAKACDDLKDKCLKLKRQIDTNTSSIESIRTPLDHKINELENKNKEQLEKIKKYAAGLKKKTAAYNELEQKYSEINEKWEIEHKEKETLKIEVNKNSALENKVQSLVEQLSDLEKELLNVRSELEDYKKTTENSLPKAEVTKMENKNLELQQHISQYTLQLEDLQNVLREYEGKYQVLTMENELMRSNLNNNSNVEITQREETIARLTIELENLRYNSQTNSNALQMKIQELEMFIETQDSELTKYKDRVNKLEEGLSHVEERRQSLEHKAIVLGAELEEKSSNYDKVSQTEDLLEQRLSALIAHDEVIESRLRETISENQELTELNKLLSSEVNNFKLKMHSSQERIAELKAYNENLMACEAENAQLKQTITILENEKRHIRSECENTLNRSKIEGEKYEVELQSQVESFNKERKILIEDCEKLSDQIQEYVEINDVLNNELSEYKEKLQEQHNDFKLKLEEQTSIISGHVKAYEKLNDDNKNNIARINELNVQLETAESLLHQKNIIVAQPQLFAEAEVQKQANFFTFETVATNDTQNLHEQIKALQNELLATETETKKITDNYEKELAHLTQEKISFETNNANLLKENSVLQNDIVRLHKEIEALRVSSVEKAAEKTVENVILQAEQKLCDDTKTENIGMFTWPQSSADPFDFIAQTSEPADHNKREQQITPKENSQEELLKKIKTLEFMLYSSEKEKEDALLQCHGLSSELTRLVYDRENYRKLSNTSDTKQNSNVESQIMSEGDTIMSTEDLEQLHNLEFEKIREPNYNDAVDHNKPVEETMEAKSAYLCYLDSTKPKVKNPEGNIPETVDSQILSNAKVKMSEADRKQLHDIEFEACKTIVPFDKTDSTKPIVEDTMRAKSAYLCYDPKQESSDGVVNNPSNTFDTFGENDDGWGWGQDEAKLEQEHQEKVVSTSHRTQFKDQINELQEKIHVLEQARERHLDEIKQSQLKSGKLIKKLKEFKTKNEELSSKLNKKSDSFDDLNDTIQDELRLQIQNLERKAKEMYLELEKERQEKNNLHKRVDTLTAAHDRMIENKEKQDVEIMAWQQRSRELSAKLEQFEWGDGGFESPKHVREIKSDEANGNARALQVQIQELTDTIKDLALDNEELQALLEEQRNLRVNAEKAKSVEPILENMKTETEYFTVLSEKNALETRLTAAEEELRVKNDCYLKNESEFDREKTVLETQLTTVEEEKLKLQEKIEFYQKREDEMTKEKSQLNDAIVQSNQTNDDLNRKLESLQSEHEILVQKNFLADEREQHNITLSSDLEKLRSENKQIQITSDALHLENLELATMLQYKNNELDNLKQSGSDFDVKISSLQQDYDTADAEISKLRHNLEETAKESVELRQSLEEKSKECEELKRKLEEKWQESHELKQNLDDKVRQLSLLEEKINQQKLDTDIKLAARIQELTEQWTLRVDQRGHDVAESWKLHLETRENEFLQIEQQLKIEINELEEKYNGLVNENNELRKNVDVEIRNEVDRISALQQQINDRQTYINELTRVLKEQQGKLDKFDAEVHSLNAERGATIINLEQLRSQLSEKEKIIDDLGKKLESTELDNKKSTEIEEQVEKYKTIIDDLQVQISNKEELLLQNSQVINNYSQELEAYKKSHPTLKQEIKEKDIHVENILEKLQNYESQKEIDDNNASVLQKQIYDYQQQLTNSSEQLQQSYFHIDTLNQEILKCTEQLQEKETEINRLKSLVLEKEREIAYALENKSQEMLSAFNDQVREIESLKNSLVQNESHYEEILSVKDIDNQNLQLQLQEQVNKNEALLKEKEEFLLIQTELSSQCAELQSKLHEQNILLDEENRQLVELREIIQDQVLKIEDLHKNLYDKSRDYDALIAEIDIPQKSRSDLASIQREKRVTFADEPENRTTIPLPPIEDLTEPASRAELDLALYMLHQRDVRCEELTVELMQLLEERDTLQLRLSNALREKEELRSKSESGDNESSRKDSPETGAVHKGKASAIVLSATGTELATEATEKLNQESRNRLTTKLSELKTVGYRKDKTFVDEQELRRFQQLSIMQQHRDEAAKLPSEAAARLVDASYTLSRDVQSPSKVLLNWLWGRSTPKVNNV